MEETKEEKKKERQNKTQREETEKKQTGQRQKRRQNPKRDTFLQRQLRQETAAASVHANRSINGDRRHLRNGDRSNDEGGKEKR